MGKSVQLGSECNLVPHQLCIKTLAFFYHISIVYLSQMTATCRYRCVCIVLRPFYLATGTATP